MAKSHRVAIAVTNKHARSCLPSLGPVRILLFPCSSFVFKGAHNRAPFPDLEAPIFIL